MVFGGSKPRQQETWVSGTAGSASGDNYYFRALLTLRLKEGSKKL
jgi:hypothetical protein